METSMKTNTYFTPRYPKNLQNEVPKSMQNQQKIQAWTPKSPFLCSQVPLDHPMVPQDAKVEAPCMPNDMFLPPKVTISVSRITDICKRVTWKLTSRNQRASTHFSREIKKQTRNQTSKNQQASNQGFGTQHDSSECQGGAGGSGRSP